MLQMNFGLDHSWVFLKLFLVNQSFTQVSFQHVFKYSQFIMPLKFFGYVSTSVYYSKPFLKCANRAF